MAPIWFALQCGFNDFSSKCPSMALMKDYSTWFFQVMMRMGLQIIVSKMVIKQGK